MKLIVNGRSYEIEFQPGAVVVGGTSFRTSVVHDNGQTTVRVGGRPFKVAQKDDGTVTVDGRSFKVEARGGAKIERQPSRSVPAAKSDAAGDGTVVALMPGTVLEVRVREGDEVNAGAVLLIVEAMKMQNEIKVPRAGKVKRVAVVPGQTVGRGDALVVVG